MAAENINYKAWNENLLAFLREKGLLDEFKDWCGGWGYPEPNEHSDTVDARRYRFLKWFFGREDAMNVPSAFKDPGWFPRVMERFPEWDQEARGIGGEGGE